MAGRTFGGALALTLLGAGPGWAQGFTSGSNGTDGALTIAANQGTVVFDPQALGLDTDGDGVYHFTTISVGAGTTLRLGASKLGEGKPVVWLATGAVQIDGTLDLSGANGHLGNQAPTPAEAGAGGYNGGPGGTLADPMGKAGSGPGGGAGGSSTSVSVGGAGSHATGGRTNNPQAAPVGATYGNRFLLPMTGGSGGGGYYRTAPPTSNAVGPGGGAGGGAILIASSTSISVSGTITVRGGRSGGGVDDAYGSGGAIRLMAPTASGAGTLDARSASINFVPQQGRGWVRVEAFVRTGLSNVQPPGAAIYSRPGLVFPPANAPTVRVSKIGTVDVTTATGSFVTPDATINASAPVSLTIVATNIPVGSTVRITLSPENGTAFTVVSQPLTGTQASSTATAGPVTIPHGFSRFHVYATFTPQ